MDLESERVLITGGAGFIGSHLSRMLLDAGALVHVVDDLFAGRRDLVPTEASFHDLDIADDDLAATVEEIEPTAVCHLAAIHYIPYCNEHPEEAFGTNVMGTRNVLESLRGTEPVDRVVYASSAAVYPPSETPHREEYEPGPTDIYGETKLVGEDLMELYHRETGVPTTSLRLFNVYGPNETNPHLIPAILEQVRDGEREIELGNTTPRRDFVHVIDVARAFVESLRAARTGYDVFNVGTGETYSVAGVVESVEQVLGEPIEIVRDEQRVRESDRPHLQASIDRIERELGWSPTVTFEEGLEGLLEEEA